MYSITVNDFNEWRKAARSLINAGVSPEKVHWQSDQQAGLFTSADINALSASPCVGQSSSWVVPSQFMSLAKKAACFIEPANTHKKWAVLYALLWRITQVDRNTLLLKSDADVQALQRMSKAVSRDRHKMKAFVRFKCVNNESDQLNPYYTAWFEPAHAIVELTAPFFVQRFTAMKWSILTPHGCAHWNQSQLTLSDGISRPEIAADQYDEFWRAYYRSIFNPARLKEQAMRSEMPKKYWKYLPESVCIKELSRGAGAQVEEMVTTAPTDSGRIRAASKAITKFQDQLRANNRK